VTPLVLVVMILVVARATRLVTTDEIFLRPRTWLGGRSSGDVVPWYVVLVNCDWCVSVWVALVAAVVAKETSMVSTWTWAAWSWLAVAMGAGSLLTWA
jgi:hypothetical protein